MTGRRGWWAPVVVVLLAAPTCNRANPSAGVGHRLTTYAGTGAAGSAGDGGPPSSMELGTPSGLAADGHGNLFIADQAEHRIRKVGADGRVTTFAGTGVAGLAGDGGAATSAQLNGPAGLALGRRGELLIADQQNNRIRQVDAQGVISTVAGSGQRGFRGDGDAATRAVLNAPAAVAVDRAGRIVVADTENRRVRRIDGDGVIATVIGGLPGEPPELELGRPVGLVAGEDGSLTVATPELHRVVRLAADGRLSVVAGGNGSVVEDTDGRAATAALSRPTGLALDRRGNLFVTEAGAGRVRRIDRTGTIFTVATGPASGLAQLGPGGSEPVTSAALDMPTAVAVGRAGRVFVADTGHHRVRELEGAATRGFTVARRPSVDSLSPSSGGAAGETAVVVRGHGFSKVETTVRFGGIAGKVVAVVPGDVGDELLVMSPPQAAGRTVDVVVSTQSGASPPSPGSRFSYTQGWLRSDPLADARFGHTATLLDPPACRSPEPPAGYPCGQVLVAGGIQPPFERPSATLGDPASVGLLERAERYDPATGTWRTAAKPLALRRSATATLLDDGRVLVVGGAGPESRDRLPDAELYDPAADRWAPTNGMARGRSGHTATLLDGPACRSVERAPWCGKVLVVGGASSDLPFDSAELYDPVSGAWASAGAIGVPRTGHTASPLADGRVLVAGGAAPTPGEPGTILATTSVEIYDPDADRWAPTDDLAIGRFDHTATVLRSGQVLVVGGNTSAEPYVFSQSAEIYDPATGTWRPAGLPLVGRAGHSATLLAGGRVVVAGGGPVDVNPIAARPDSLSSAELYDPASNRWTETRTLNTARVAHTANRLDGPRCRGTGPPAYCGGVLVVGGGGTSINPDSFSYPLPLGSAELYRPS